MHLADKSQALVVVVAQLAASFLAAIALVAFGWVYAYSGLIGGLTATCANALFALIVFAHYRAQNPGKLVARFYGGELVKLAVTGFGFAASILWIDPLSVGALLGTYMFVVLVPALGTKFFN